MGNMNKQEKETFEETSYALFRTELDTSRFHSQYYASLKDMWKEQIYALRGFYQDYSEHLKGFEEPQRFLLEYVLATREFLKSRLEILGGQEKVEIEEMTEGEMRLPRYPGFRLKEYIDRMPPGDFEMMSTMFREDYYNAGMEYPLWIADIVGEFYLRYFIKEHGINADLFTRHSGWSSSGFTTLSAANDSGASIIADPFDGVTLYYFNERNIASVSITLHSGADTSCVVARLFDNTIYFADNQNIFIRFISKEMLNRGKTNINYIKSATSEYQKPLEDARIEIGTTNPKRIASYRPIIQHLLQTNRKGRIGTDIGQYAPMKLVKGTSDVVLNFINGDPIHKCIYLFIPQQAGMVVRDVHGQVFDVIEQIRRLKADPRAKYEFTATRPEYSDATTKLVEEFLPYTIVDLDDAEREISELFRS
ncbi:MAG: hypothetical protein J4473_00400 [Candidatus Aenigmarchaeota archaeon]|nr:hypothetical protein [Candidatus Aenigmarchaeota archaeon]